MSGSRVPELHFRDFVPDGGWFHTARNRYEPGSSFSAHTHDFAEVFWIDAGRGQHRANDAGEMLETGTVRIIEPSDRHLFRAGLGEGLLLVNVAFPAPLLADLARRFSNEDGYSWYRRFRPRDSDPSVATAALPGGAVSTAGRRRLDAAFSELVRSRQSSLSIERFLISVVDVLENDAYGFAGESTFHIGDSLLLHDDAPSWLLQALRQFSRSRELLREGIAALTELCGKSEDHVNRTVRRVAGQTATSVVNGLRLADAATRLRTTDEEIVEIAFSDGFNNLSHFYRLFRGEYGMAPRRYRELHRRIVSGD